jgi:secondary thiamine-phosphate synthase enzyme
MTNPAKKRNPSIKKFAINTTQTKEVVDLTSRLNELISETEINHGWGSLFVLHTTCCLTTADLDPGTDQDYLQAIERIFPQGNYRHPHDPNHVGDHIMSSIIGPSVDFPIENGSLKLGTWQKVVLIELNGPRERELMLKIENFE